MSDVAQKMRDRCETSFEMSLSGIDDEELREALIATAPFSKSMYFEGMTEGLDRGKETFLAFLDTLIKHKQSELATLISIRESMEC